MAEHELLPGAKTVHWGYLDASLPPVLEIDDGDIVTVHSVSGSLEEAPYGNSAIRPELRAIHRALSPELGPHILTGPIHVKGAVPGDTLKIDILDVSLRDDWGYNIIRPDKGVLPEDFHKPHTVHFGIDKTSGTIIAPWGGMLQARPFFGVISTAPKPEDGRRTSIEPGYFGGNLDNKELVAGSTLYLPVSVDGALVSIGDGHAAQGDGEVCLTAVETGLTGRFRLTLLKAEYPRSLYAETQTHLIAMGFGDTIDSAVRQAVANAISLICGRTGMSAANAYTLCSVASDVRITQLVNVVKGAHVMIPKSAFPPAKP